MLQPRPSAGSATLLTVLCALSFSVFLGCRPEAESSSSIKEIAMRDVRSQPVLLYVDQGWVYQMECAPNTIVFSHESCSQIQGRVPASRFYAFVFKSYGGDAGRHEANIAQIYVRMTQIYNKELEFIDASPTAPMRSDILDTLRLKQVDLGALEIDISGLADQVARINEALQRSGVDDNLRMQLAIVTESLGKKRTEANTLKESMNVMRQTYIASNATLIDTSTYEDLERERSSLNSRLQSERGLYQDEINRSIAAARAIKRLEDHFPYNYMSPQLNPDTSDAVYRAFPSAFADAMNEYRLVEFQKNATRPTEVSAAVDRDGVVESLECTFRAATQYQCNEMVITSPYGEYNARGTAFRVNTACPGCGPEGLSSLVVGKPVRGIWKVRLVCGMIIIGGGTTPIEQASCQINVKWF